MKVTLAVAFPAARHALHFMLGGARWLFLPCGRASCQKMATAYVWSFSVFSFKSGNCSSALWSMIQKSEQSSKKSADTSMWFMPSSRRSEMQDASPGPCCHPKQLPHTCSSSGDAPRSKDSPNALCEFGSSASRASPLHQAQDPV